MNLFRNLISTDSDLLSDRLETLLHVGDGDTWGGRDETPEDAIVEKGARIVGRLEAGPLCEYAGRLFCVVAQDSGPLAVPVADYRDL